MWTCDGRGDPRQDDDGRGIEGSRKKHHGEVSCSSVGSGNGNDVGNDGDKEGADDVQGSLLLLVGMPPVDGDAEHAE